jgi:hypothetical protein
MKSLITDQLIDLIYNYLEDYGWTKKDISKALQQFKETHGYRKFKALILYVNCADEENYPKLEVTINLGHDLNGSNDRFMFPRTYSIMMKYM